MPKSKGWRKQPARHALAAKGVCTDQTAMNMLGVRTGKLPKIGRAIGPNSVRWPSFAAKLDDEEKSILLDLKEVHYIDYDSDSQELAQFILDIETMKMGYRRIRRGDLVEPQHVKRRREESIQMIQRREEKFGERYARALSEVEDILWGQSSRRE